MKTFLFIMLFTLGCVLSRPDGAAAFSAYAPANSSVETVAGTDLDYSIQLESLWVEYQQDEWCEVSATASLGAGRTSVTVTVTSRATTCADAMRNVFETFEAARQWLREKW